MVVMVLLLMIAFVFIFIRCFASSLNSLSIRRAVAGTTATAAVIVALKTSAFFSRIVRRHCSSDGVLAALAFIPLLVLLVLFMVIMARVQRLLMVLLLRALRGMMAVI